MKKAIIMIITMFIIIPTNVMALTNKNGVIISDSEYENLKSMGFSEKEIEYIPYDIYLENRDLHGEVVSTSTKYYKGILKNKYSALNVNENTTDDYIDVEITKKEYEKYNNFEFRSSIMGNPDTSEMPGGMKKMTTRIIKEGTTYRVKNTIHWKSMPKFRGKDLIGIGINNSVVEPKSGSDRSYAHYEVFDECANTELENMINGTAIKKAAGGYVHLVNLPKDTSYEVKIQKPYATNWPCNTTYPNWNGVYTFHTKVKSLDITMYYDLVKIKKAPLSAYGSYKHAKRSISADISTAIGIGTAGITFNTSMKDSYDYMPNTQAQIENPNW